MENNTVELTPKQYAALLKPPCSSENITKKIRNGGFLKGVVKHKKFGKYHVLVVDKSLL